MSDIAHQRRTVRAADSLRVLERKLMLASFGLGMALLGGLYLLVRLGH